MTRRTLYTTMLAVAACFVVQSVRAAVPEDFAEKADAALQQHLENGDFSGVVLIADRGKPILRKAYGLANREWGVPATPDTEFRIGSTTKQFTAAAIFQLVEAGRIKLDDPIRQYVQNTPLAWSNFNHAPSSPTATLATPCSDWSSSGSVAWRTVITSGRG